MIIRGFRLQVLGYSIISFLLLLFTVHYTLSPVFAAEEFGTSYDVVYDISENGETLVTEKITLRNLTSQYYASQFKLTIGATQITDVSASDDGGVMETKIEQKDSSTSIEVKFNQQVAGLGKQYPWTLQFKSKDFAEKIGKVWEVRAPKISSSTNLENYNLTISVPLSFGDPTLITPIPKSQTVSSGRLFLTFTKDQIQSSGVSANFGNIQLFDFDLTFHLENSSLVPILTNIALPPDTSFQDVIYQRIEPQPINITIDEDGNYLAWYRLVRGQKLDIKVVGSAKLYSNSKVKNPTLDNNLKNKYLSSDEYWEKDNPQILSRLDEILGPSPPQTTEEKARLIFLYVVNNLKYDQGRLSSDIERFGAVTALNNPTSAVCMEFTDLFITLARAAGIPARELNGFAYTANPTLRPLSLTKDILHAWPEYFDDKKGWVMVDPTWENTTGGVDYFSKLDLNHFVFVTKGVSSSQPIPAGSYKYQGVDSRDVKVNLSETDFLGKSQIDVKILEDGQLFAGFPGKIKVKISNFGNSLLSSSDLKVLASNINLESSNNLKTGPIPAYGNAEFTFNVKTKSLFEQTNDNIEVLIGSQKFNKEISIKPFLLFQTVPLIIAGIVFLMLAVYSTILFIFFYRRRISKSKVALK